jgi:C_GCAxxG_C_C family probable redox protein
MRRLWHEAGNRDQGTGSSDQETDFAPEVLSHAQFCEEKRNCAIRTGDFYCSEGGAMSNKSDKAIELFQTFNCAQSVLGVCGPQDDRDQKLGVMLASGFGAGMARQGFTCGAVTGAIMAIGYRECAKGATDFVELKERLYGKVVAFSEEFKSRYGSLDCRELIGCDLRTPEGKKEFQEKNLHKDVCDKVVAGAVELLEQE